MGSAIWCEGCGEVLSDEDWETEICSSCADGVDDVESAEADGEWEAEWV